MRGSSPLSMASPTTSTSSSTSSPTTSTSTSSSSPSLHCRALGLRRSGAANVGGGVVSAAALVCLTVEIGFCETLDAPDAPVSTAIPPVQSTDIHEAGSLGATDMTVHSRRSTLAGLPEGMGLGAATGPVLSGPSLAWVVLMMAAPPDGPAALVPAGRRRVRSTGAGVGSVHGAAAGTGPCNDAGV
jgi:hypothetical protein